MMAGKERALLEVQNLTKSFEPRQSLFAKSTKGVQILNGVSFSVAKGETLGIVGESGCGKSTLARCLVRLHDVSSGRIYFEGNDITSLSARRLKPFRRKLQMVFQDPGASLNPRRRIGDLIGEPLRVHAGLSGADLSKRVDELLDQVGLSRGFRSRFPHECSGGQRQRVGIARALALDPSLIIADEPVSALDVSVQAQIINLFSDLQERLELAFIFISHNLAVVRQISHRVAVMYLGSIVETGPAERLFEAPSHPYTEALLASIPVVGGAAERQRVTLSGDVPSPGRMPSGCCFHPRCRYATARCKAEQPQLTESDGRYVACHHPRPGH